jgi:hypothetical protein
MPESSVAGQCCASETRLSTAVGKAFPNHHFVGETARVAPSQDPAYPLENQAWRPTRPDFASGHWLEKRLQGVVGLPGDRPTLTSRTHDRAQYRSPEGRQR